MYTSTVKGDYSTGVSLAVPGVLDATFYDDVSFDSPTALPVWARGGKIAKDLSRKHAHFTGCVLLRRLLHALRNYGLLNS